MATYFVDDYGAVRGPYTVAEWLTGGLYDQGYADLAAIQVDHPRALELATTIDQVAFEEAVDDAIANTDAAPIVRWGSGTYYWHRQTSWISVNYDSDWTFYGEGIGTTTLTRMDNVVQAGVEGSGKMIDIRPGSSATCSFEVYGFTHEGNSSGNALNDPEGNPFEFQQSAFWRQRPEGSAYTTLFYVHDIEINDRIGPGIQQTANAVTGPNQGEFRVRDVTAERTVRRRGCLEWLQGTELVDIRDCDVVRIETEQIGGSLTNQVARIYDCTTKILDLGGPTSPTAGNEDTSLAVDVQRVTSNHWRYLYAGGTFTDCDLGVLDINSTRNVQPTTWTRCTMLARVESGVVTKPLGDQRGSDLRTMSTEYIDCTFGYGDLSALEPGAAETELTIPTGPFTGSLFDAGSILVGITTKTDKWTTKMTRCEFLPGAEYGLTISRNGWHETTDCIINGTVAAVRISHGGTDRSAGWVSTNDQFYAPLAYEVPNYGADGDQKTQVELNHNDWQSHWLVDEGTAEEATRIVWTKTRNVRIGRDLDPSVHVMEVNETAQLDTRVPSTWTYDDAATNRWSKQ